MAAKSSSAVTVQFNRRAFTFKNRATLEAQVKRANGKAPAPDAKAKALKHRIYLPGLKAPTSLQWVAKHLFETDPIGVSANGKQKGAYHPAQVLASASKLTAFGVKVESDAASMRYGPWSATAAKALAQYQKQQKQQKQQTPPVKKQTAAKKTPPAPVKKQRATAKK